MKNLQHNSISTECGVPYVTDVDYHIIDDRSSEYFKDSLTKICEESKQKVTFDFLGDRDTEGQDPHSQSRFSVKVAYDYIYNLPDEDFVYIVDDDHLHTPNAIKRMLVTWNYLDYMVNFIHPRDEYRKKLWAGGITDHQTNLKVFQFDERTDNDIGIFPQCFVQMFPYQSNPTMDFYVRPCIVLPTPTGYYRTTWYTHETFMLKAKVFKKHKETFDRLQVTGTPEAGWEGDTISDLWKEHVKMFMPLDPSVMHMSVSRDLPFTWRPEHAIKLWEDNITPYSLPENSDLNLKPEDIIL
tara:strand:+ start:112 stop:1002 length:891 start_codon:yes stop_codon:yes gene_type:complete